MCILTMNFYIVNTPTRFDAFASSSSHTTQLIFSDYIFTDIMIYINSLQDYTHKNFPNFNDYVCSHKVNNIHILQL